jgi:hypothetical protein
VDEVDLRERVPRKVRVGGQMREGDIGRENG